MSRAAPNANLEALFREAAEAMAEGIYECLEPFDIFSSLKFKEYKDGSWEVSSDSSMLCFSGSSQDVSGRIDWKERVMLINRSVRVAKLMLRKNVYTEHNLKQLRKALRRSP
jgi:hypothetical protein